MSTRTPDLSGIKETRLSRPERVRRDIERITLYQRELSARLANTTAAIRADDRYADGFKQTQVETARASLQAEAKAEAKRAWSNLNVHSDSAAHDAVNAARGRSWPDPRTTRRTGRSRQGRHGRQLWSVFRQNPTRRSRAPRLSAYHAPRRQRSRTGRDEARTRDPRLGKAEHRVAERRLTRHDLPKSAQDVLRSNVAPT
jgi:hypothetical protein